MTNRTIWGATAAICMAVVAAAIFYKSSDSSPSSANPVTTSVDRPTGHSAVSADKSVSTLSNTTADDDPLTPVDNATDAQQLAEQNLSNLDLQSADLQNGAQSETAQPAADVYAIARGSWTEQEFDTLVRSLDRDAQLRAALLSEYRSETDPQRLHKITMLLGNLNDPQIVEVAASMASSGNPASQTAALDLLRRLAPSQPAARTAALQMLSSNADPEVLVAALNAFSVSVKTSNAQRGHLLDQVATLSQHDDPSVRRHSMAVTARWAHDSSASTLLVSGLNDSDAAVRRTTAYSLVGFDYADEQIVEALFERAEDSTEQSRTQRAAVRALQSLNLDSYQQQRLAALNN